MHHKVKKYSIDNKFKFCFAQILQPLHTIEVPMLLAGEQDIKLDAVDSDMPIFLSKNTIKQWNLTINTGDETTRLVVNDKLKEIELYTSARKYWCIIVYIFQ